jgi:hypothetical protein
MYAGTTNTHIIQTHRYTGVLRVSRFAIFSRRLPPSGGVITGALPGLVLPGRLLVRAP